MKQTTLACLIFVILMTGCAAKQMAWSNPEKSNQEFNEDLEHCIMFADSARASRQAMMPVDGSNKSMNSFANGYNLGNAFGGPAAADSRYYDCMDRRGWKLVEKQQPPPEERKTAASFLIPQKCDEWLAAAPGSQAEIAARSWSVGYVAGVITAQVATMANEKGCDIEGVNPYYPSHDELFAQVTEFCRQHPEAWMTAASVVAAMECVDKTEICH